MSNKDNIPVKASFSDIKGDSNRPSNQSSSGPPKNNSSSRKKTGSRNRDKSIQTPTKTNGNIKTRNKGSDLLDDSNDIMSILKTAKKGTNISHLLTYNYFDEDKSHKNDRDTKSNRPRSSKKQNENSSSIHLHGLSYINANYKFVLNNQTDYKPQLLDPNLPVDIKDVHRVLVKQHDYHCPICMGEEFIAPRMTKCGHIFCYPCLIRMFENTRNDKSKTDLGNQHNPFISCPLCSEVIRERFPTLPVLIEQVREEEKVIKQNSFKTLSLMYRGSSRMYSQSVLNFYQYKGFNGPIPWISQDCTPLNYKQYSPYVSNSRLMLCDLDFVASCFQKEVDDIMTQKFLDFEVYGDSGEYYDLTIAKINNELKNIEQAIQNADSKVKGPPQFDTSSLDIASMSLSEPHEVRLPSFKDGFYYYQCDINSRIQYHLSPLDMKVINQLFDIPDLNTIHPDMINPYLAYNLPISLNVFVENVNYEDGKITPELVGKNAHFSNLPYGSEVGLLEIDWSKFDSSFIPVDSNVSDDPSTGNSKYPIQIPAYLVKQLQARTKNTKQKRSKEESARVRGELRREKETLEIFTKDDNKVNYPESDDEFIYQSNKLSKSKLNRLGDFESTPILSAVTSNTNLAADNQSDKSIQPLSSTTTSVWGTMVPVILDPEEEALRAEESRQIQDLIDAAKSSAAMSGNGKKGKKGRRAKMIPLPL